MMLADAAGACFVAGKPREMLLTAQRARDRLLLRSVGPGALPGRPDQRHGAHAGRQCRGRRRGVTRSGGAGRGLAEAPRGPRAAALARAGAAVPARAQRRARRDRTGARGRAGARRGGCAAVPAQPRRPRSGDERPAGRWRRPPTPRRSSSPARRASGASSCSGSPITPGSRRGAAAPSSAARWPPRRWRWPKSSDWPCTRSGRRQRSASSRWGQGRRTPPPGISSASSG